MARTISILLFGAVTALHLLSIVTPYPKARSVSKVFLMPLLLVFYLATAGEPQLYIVLALVFSTLGDILLLWPRVTALFLLGAGAFGLAHLFYVLQLARSATVGTVWLWVLVAVLMLTVYVLVYRFLRTLLPQKMRVPVLLYGLLIASMAYFSAMRLVEHPAISSLVGLVGALCFIVSDTVLATDVFGESTKQKYLALKNQPNKNDELDCENECFL